MLHSSKYTNIDLYFLTNSKFLRILMETINMYNYFSRQLIRSSRIAK